MNIDPTHDEMMETLVQSFKGLLDAETIANDGEIAIYWFASNWHGGQSSSLYSVLCNSVYSPGRLSSFEKDMEDCILMMYDKLNETFIKK